MERSLVVDFAKKPNLTPKICRLFFRDFMGKEEDLRLILEDHQNRIIRINFRECCLLSCEQRKIT